MFWKIKPSLFSLVSINWTRSIGILAYFWICSVGTNSRLLIAASIMCSILRSSVSSSRNTLTAMSALDIQLLNRLFSSI